jgi:predicted DsbA family dithiol-disulfide isomerase
MTDQGRGATVEVFADVTCPFAHVALRRFIAERDARGRDDIALRVRAWPLELVNGHAEPPSDVADAVQALRATVAPELFRGFDPAGFPSTSLPALAMEAELHAADPVAGERFSMLVRTSLFEDGSDISALAVLAELAASPPRGTGEAQVLADWNEGKARNVKGSPHFFVDGARFFCPSMKVDTDGDQLEVEFDEEGFTTFLDRCLTTAQST